MSSLLVFMVLHHFNFPLATTARGYPRGVITQLTSLVVSVLQGGAGGVGGPYTR